jgi:nitrate/TMAO reductase-like tetraheme cytochrome c subunit
MHWKLILAAAAGCAVAAAAQDSRPPSRRAPHERIDRPSVEACGACHAEVYREWSQSLHFRAWTNANVRAATNQFAMEGCRACHSPMPVLATGLDSRPSFRDFNREDGVHCLSCHGLEDGVAAARDVPDAPCRPRRDERILKAELCYPCHQPTHQAFSEYYESKAFKSGTRCQDCHMPAEGARRSHGPNGGFNDAFVRKAIDWKCDVADGKLKLTIVNRTGHKFPGEIPSRALVIQWQSGSAPATFEVLRRPNKGEDRADNRLKPDEVRTMEWNIEPGRSAELKLWFQPLPLLPEEKSIPIGAWRR